MERKKKIVRLTNYAHSSLLAFLDTVGEEEKNKVGLVDHWSIKDHYAHIAWWMNHYTDRLIKRSPEKQIITDIDKENAKVFEHHKNKSFSEIMISYDQVFEKLGHQIRILSEEELNSTTILPALSERGLWHSLLGDSCMHPITHLNLLYIETGHPEKPVEIHEAIFEDLQSMDDSPRWRGVTIYNMGCTYALGGRKEEAIKKVTEALKIHPDLKEWSQHDPDLESIRNEPEYLELYS